MMPRHPSLSDSYTSDRCCFPVSTCYDWQFYSPRSELQNKIQQNHFCDKYEKNVKSWQIVLMFRDAISFRVQTATLFLSLVKCNQISIVITFSQLIWHQMLFRLVPTQSEKVNYNQNLVWIRNIQKWFLCVYTWFVLKIWTHSFFYL